MPMRCPRCSTPPPFDPFLCTTCGEHLLTYLDEPLGPGTGVRPDGMADGVAVRTAGGRVPPPYRIGPAPGIEPGQPIGPAPARQPDNTGPVILKLLFGLFVAMVLFSEQNVGGLLFLAVVVFALVRWPRARLLPFGLILVATAATIWVGAELVDEIDSPRLFATPTPTPNRAATSTAIAIAGTPTLAPAARTATATVVAGDNRVKLSRARARWLRGDNAAALAELDDALTLIPGLAETHNLRALVKIAAGDYQGGAADAQRALTAQPSNPVYRDTRAYALLKLGRYDDAAREYDTVRSDPRSDAYVAAYLGRGVARTALGRLTEARTDLERGLRLLPDTDPDPQLADLEIAARRALDPLAPRAGSPSPAVSPVASPAASPVVQGTPTP